MSDALVSPTLETLLIDLQARVGALERLVSRAALLRTVRGVVNADGTIAEGDGFSITKNGTGDYTINFAPAFNDVPSVTMLARQMAGGAPLFMLRDVPVTASAAEVLTYNWSGGALLDALFHFVAVGP